MPQPLPPHVQWLATHRGTELKTRLESEHVGLGVQAALAVMVEADPSPSSHAVQWLFDTYLASGYRWEDIMGGKSSKVGQTVVWFAQHRTGLQGRARNLSSYASLAQVYMAVAPLLEDRVEPVKAVQGGRALRRAQRLAARCDSIMVHESPELIVAVPTSQSSAQWWGRGTRWCTAADQDNMFDNYNREGPLIVTVLPGVAVQPSGVAGNTNLQAGGKLQLWIDNQGRAQFMDATDSDVDPEFVWAHWDRLEPLVIWGAEQSVDLFRYVPRDRQTVAMCRRAVSQHGCNLALVDPKLMDEAMCAMAVVNYSEALQYVPSHLVTKTVCVMATSRNMYAFPWVPQHCQTPEMCLAAIRDDGLNLAKVYDKTAFLCKEAVERNGFALTYVPAGLMTQQIIDTALSRQGRALAHVPPEFLSERVCTIAVQADGRALQYVPPEFMTTGLVHEAVEHRGAMLEYVPAHLVNEQICLMAVRNDGRALEHVPARLQDMELYMEAMTACVPSEIGSMQGVPLELIERFLPRQPYLVLHMESHQLTQELCLTALEQEKSIFRLLAPEHRTMAVCRLAVGRDGMELEHVPLELRTEEICTLALQSDSWALPWVPPALRTRELCQLAIERREYMMDYTGYVGCEDASLLALIPHQLVDRDIAYHCLRIEPNSIDSLPPALLDSAMCSYAVEHQGSAITRVPEHLRTAAMWRSAVEDDEMLFEQMPPHYQDARTCLAVVGKLGSMLYDVRPDLRSLEVCLAAIEEQADAIDFVPEHIMPQIHASVPGKYPLGQQWTADKALNGLAQALADKHTTSAWVGHQEDSEDSSLLTLLRMGAYCAT